LLGEVDYPQAITLRTSIIGHELRGAQGLVCWFLTQSGSVRGYRRAIFSGVPAVELAKIIRDFVIPHQELRGLYHVAVDAINKGDLLQLIASVYGIDTEIVPDDAVVVDRSLDATRFKAATGYRPPPWRQLIEQMHDFR
jgi:dTDP-4-dehydrorhamnose reductase